MAGTQVQLRRGTTAEHATFTGAEGEVTVDTTKDTLVAHDGTTAGGIPIAREDLTNVATIPATKGGTGLTSSGTSGNVLTSNGTTWTSAAPSGSVVTKEVTSTSDLSLTNWTTGTLPTTINNIGDSFSVDIPTSGVIKLNISLRLQNGEADYAYAWFGIRISSTNYLFGHSVLNGTDAIYRSTHLYVSGNSLNDYQTFYGTNAGNYQRPSFNIDIASQSVPTGTQTVQLFAAGVGTAIIKGTALTTRALIQFIGVN